MGILGNSDSHSYQDSVTFREQRFRGGAFRPSTLQWTEVWARLRPGEIDLGEWGVWGTNVRLARIGRWLGIEGRAPRKQDYRYNMSYSGARCEQLTESAARQTQPLVHLMSRDSARWSRGLVVIRIGINSVGKTSDLEEYARTGATPQARMGVDHCVEHIRQAVRLIHDAHPNTLIVLVGIADDANVVGNHARWRSGGEVRNIAAVLNLFDAQLRSLAASDTKLAFLDERAWFQRHWGGRNSDGAPAYHAVHLGGTDSVGNTRGDHPRNLGVEDGHTGTVGNGLWLAALIELANERWNLGLRPVTPHEIASLADPRGEFGIRAR